jgi:hypothetical protein
MSIALAQLFVALVTQSESPDAKYPGRDLLQILRSPRIRMLPIQILKFAIALGRTHFVQNRVAMDFCQTVWIAIVNAELMQQQRGSGRIAGAHFNSPAASNELLSIGISAREVFRNPSNKFSIGEPLDIFGLLLFPDLGDDG